MKLRWVEIQGMIYVEDPEDDYDHCARCALYNLDVCVEVECVDNVFIPLEPQHIPNLRKKGKTKWQRN